MLHQHSSRDHCTPSSRRLTVSACGPSGWVRTSAYAPRASSLWGPRSQQEADRGLYESPPAPAPGEGVLPPAGKPSLTMLSHFIFIRHGEENAHFTHSSTSWWGHTACIHLSTIFRGQDANPLFCERVRNHLTVLTVALVTSAPK